MTKLGNENLCAVTETTKRRAHAIKARLEAMGYNASLSHAYEVLATASGYRNWPTMKAATARGVETITHGVPISAMPETGKNVLGSTNSKVLLERNSPDISIYERFDEGSGADLAAWIARRVEEEGTWGIEWKGRVTVLLHSIMRALVDLRDHKGRKIDVESIRNILPFDRYVEFASEMQKSDAPEDVREIISDYLDFIGYVAGDAGVQTEIVVETHDYLEAIISDALSMIETSLRWQSFQMKWRSRQRSLKLERLTFGGR